MSGLVAMSSMVLIAKRALSADERDRTLRDLAHRIVRRWGRAATPALDAVQIEINSGMLMSVPRREYFARIDRGEPAAAKHADHPPVGESFCDRKEDLS